MPGNPGIENIATCIPGDIMDNDFILNTCKENFIDLLNVLVIKSKGLNFILNLSNY